MDGVFDLWKFLEWLWPSSTRSAVGTNELPLGVVATEVEVIVEFRDQEGA